MKIKIIITFFTLFSGIMHSQTKEDVFKIVKHYDLLKINDFKKTLEEREIFETKKAYKVANTKGWPITIEGKDGSFQELMGLTPDGFPIYYSTHNVNAARSTRTNFLNSGGGLGLSLDGQNMVARVWDGGTVRRSHLGLGGRVTTVDNSGTTYSSHATHVTGTILALPWDLDSFSIKGMASQATARTFNWTFDESEALSEVALGMLVSNHSYGVPLSTENGALPAWYIGSYVYDSYVWDEIAHLSPYYLPVFSAGNDGTNTRNEDPIAIGYDKLIGNKVSKNVLTIANAQDANIASDGTLISAFINQSSSQGPTDDRRIKPDITGNGTSLTSLNSSSDTAVSLSSGTSMSAPNVTGTLLLLQQHHKNITNSFMKAATLKGLACHTADDAGSVGPDPIFGWGLLNAKKAAETISTNGLASWISEEKLTQGNSFTMTVKSDGFNPLIASITWTDVPGEPNNGQRLIPNDSFKALVNDLDIRISKDGAVFYPWRLNSISPMLPAIQNSDNDVDNVEIIKINNPTPGDYLITITHKGNLVGGAQDYSLVVTGITSNFALISNSDDVEICSNQSVVYTFDYKHSGTQATNFTATGIPSGANVAISPAILNSDGIVTMTITNIPSSLYGEFNVGIIGNNGIETETRFKKLRVFSSIFDPITTVSPVSGFDGISTRVNLTWQSNVNAESYTLQVATTPNFQSTFVNQQTSELNFIVSGLAEQTIYYWRVIPTNRCGSGILENATVSSFKTGILTCGNLFTATDFSNATIANVANSSASVPIEITGGLKIGEMRVNLALTHTYIQDMTISLIGPAAIGSPTIVLLREACGNNDDMNCRFIDGGLNPSCINVIPSLTGDVRPNQFLLNLNGLIADGTWTLQVNDPYNGDGGVIDSLSIEVCNLTTSLSSNDNLLESLKVYPNPSKGIFNIDLAGSVIGETTFELFDIQGRKVISKVSSNAIETLNVENLSDGIYMLTIQNGSAKTTKKVVINK